MGFGREGEGADVAFEEGDNGIIRDVRGGGLKAGGVPGEDGDLELECELAVGVEEGFEQPVAEEAGARR